VTQASHVRVWLKYELMPEKSGTSVAKNRSINFFDQRTTFVQPSSMYESVDVNIKLVTCRGDYPPII
jgi:hypothetical protein